jgi:septum formation topological specificity factor MinE
VVHLLKLIEMYATRSEFHIYKDTLKRKRNNPQEDMKLMKKEINSIISKHITVLLKSKQYSIGR